MTRKQQTAWIAGAIIAVGIFLAFVLWPAPNLDGLSNYDKCAYSSYRSTHGGTLDECQAQAAADARARLGGNIPPELQTNF